MGRKIKHIFGYGCVKASLEKDKIEENQYYYGMSHREIIIKVEGNHERGIYFTDLDILFNWLVKRFVKDANIHNLWLERTDDGVADGTEWVRYTFRSNI